MKELLRAHFSHITKAIQISLRTTKDKADRRCFLQNQEKGKRFQKSRCQDWRSDECHPTCSDQAALPYCFYRKKLCPA